MMAKGALLLLLMLLTIRMTISLTIMLNGGDYGDAGDDDDHGV